MSVYQASGVEIDFSAAQSSEKHDDANRIWDGVDFLVDDGARHLWVEVKSWSAAVIPPRRRGGQRRSYLSKMGSGAFARDLRSKFVGTCAFQALTGASPAMPITYLMLLESSPADAALRSHLTTRMRELIPRYGSSRRPWKHPVEVVALDVEEWNRRFPECPARLI